jgi:hypothetical protein
MDRAPQVEANVPDAACQAGRQSRPAEHDLITSCREPEGHVPEVPTDASIGGLVAE